MPLAAETVGQPIGTEKLLSINAFRFIENGRSTIAGTNIRDIPGSQRGAPSPGWPSNVWRACPLNEIPEKYEVQTLG